MFNYLNKETVFLEEKIGDPEGGPEGVLRESRRGPKGSSVAGSYWGVHVLNLPKFYGCLCSLFYQKYFTGQLNRILGS